MTASAEFLADSADIDDVGFRTHAHAHFAIGQFFKKNGNDNAANGAQVNDQPLVILGKDAQFSGCFQGETKTCDATFLLETHGAQQFSQKLQTPSRIILIELLAQASNIETRANEFSRNFESVGVGFWILKRASIGRDRGVKIFRDVLIERQTFALDQPKNDFSCGGSRRIDINHVAIAGITQMVVNINPDF